MLGDISAIATLILFVIYFIGRTITILMERDVCYDQIVFLPIEDAKQYDIIEEIETGDINSNMADDSCTMVVLTSVQGIRKIKVFKIAYDKELNEMKKKTKEIASCDFLNIGQSFAIKTYVPELIPQYRIVYRTQDYKKVTLDISDNLKNGVVSEMLQPKHTCASVLYYLFR